MWRASHENIIPMKIRYYTATSREAHIRQASLVWCSNDGASVHDGLVSRVWLLTVCICHVVGCNASPFVAGMYNYIMCLVMILTDS